MTIAKLIALFLIINFGGLALGGWLMAGGSSGEWYTNLNIAPWTPPGWVFGFAWTTIMICFSVYLGYHFNILKGSRIIWLFSLQLFLNVIWNYVFFNRHWIGLGLTVILALTLVVFFYFFAFKTGKLAQIRFLLIPYMLWLCIATSLNAYIYLNN